MIKTLPFTVLLALCAGGLTSCSWGIPFVPESIDIFDTDFWSGGDDEPTPVPDVVYDFSVLWFVTIPIVLIILATLLPSTRPAVTRFISSLFNLLAVIPEIIVAFIRQVVPDKWKPERWRDDDAGGTPKS